MTQPQIRLSHTKHSYYREQSVEARGSKQTHSAQRPNRFRSGHIFVSGHGWSLA